MCKGHSPSFPQGPHRRLSQNKPLKDVIRSNEYLGETYNQLGELGCAIHFYRSAIMMKEVFYSLAPNQDLLFSYKKIASILKQQKRDDKALEYRQKAEARSKALAKKE